MFEKFRLIIFLSNEVTTEENYVDYYLTADENEYKDALRLPEDSHRSSSARYQSQEKYYRRTRKFNRFRFRNFRGNKNKKESPKKVRKR